MPYHLATPQYLKRAASVEKARDWDHLPIPCFLGWVKGLEPSTPGTTIRCSNQLSYTHHIYKTRWQSARTKLARQKGFEPLAYCLEGSCSIRLSYWRVSGAGDENRTRIPSLEGWCPGHCATPAYKPPARIILQQQIVSFIIIAHSAAVVNRIFLEFTTKNWGGSMLIIKRFFFMDRLGRNNSKTFRMLKHHLRIIFRFCAARRSKVWLASSRKVTSRCQCILSTLQ